MIKLQMCVREKLWLLLSVLTLVMYVWPLANIVVTVDSSVVEVLVFMFELYLYSYQSFKLTLAEQIFP